MGITGRCQYEASKGLKISLGGFCIVANDRIASVNGAWIRAKTDTADLSFIKIMSILREKLLTI